jgi:hypothetical protein
MLVVLKLKHSFFDATTVYCDDSNARDDSVAVTTALQGTTALRQQRENDNQQ